MDNLTNKPHTGKPHAGNGVLVIVESLDGGGSGTVVSGLRNWAEEQSYKIFDLVEYWKKNKEDPPYLMMKKADVIISCEPTWVHDGLTLREIILKDTTNRYSARETAEYFSRDRQRLFSSILGQALSEGKIIFQERSFFSSMTYQIAHAKLHSQELSVEEVLGMPGNRYVSEQYSPDLLILLNSDTKINQQRLLNREKKDDAWYEQEEFQNAVKTEYQSETVRNFVNRKGIILRGLDTSIGSAEDTKAKAQKIWLEFYGQEKI